ncbi:MAG: hypothetical protein HUU04_00540 [Verrucomicrobiae bacterium]|nr:hypothetical protein [Verrucomicrobiae bacterium]
MKLARQAPSRATARQDFRWSWGVRLVYLLAAARSAAAAFAPRRSAGRRFT